MANWRPLADTLGFTKSDFKKALSEFRTLPRTHFLFDENVQTNVIRAIRAYGMRVDYVRELGYRRRSDHEVLALAWKRKQMLVTYDRDFWDDERFPFGSFAGVLQLPDIGKNLDFFWRILTGPVRLFSRGHDLWFNTKIRVGEGSRITVKTWEPDLGKIVTSHYWMQPRGKLLIWK
jgi:Domain of unknown function (DUF5615)